MYIQSTPYIIMIIIIFPSAHIIISCCASYCWIFVYSPAASRTPLLRCPDEFVAQAAHPLRGHRLPVRAAARDYHHAAGILARGALPLAGAALPAARVRREQPAAAALGEHDEECLPRDLRLGVRQLRRRIRQWGLLCDQARRVELQDLQ